MMKPTVDRLRYGCRPTQRKTTSAWRVHNKSLNLNIFHTTVIQTNGSRSYFYQSMTRNKGLQNHIGWWKKITRSRMLDIKVDVANNHTWEVAETNDEHAVCPKHLGTTLMEIKAQGRLRYHVDLYDKPIWKRMGRSRDMMGNVVFQAEDRLCCYIIIFCLIKGWNHNENNERIIKIHLSNLRNKGMVLYRFD